MNWLYPGILLWILCSAAAYAQVPGPTGTGSITSDTVAGTNDTGKKATVPKPPYVHQIKIAFDISKIPLNFAYHSRNSYEFQADYLLRKEVYMNAEAGFGKGTIDYSYLNYNTNSFFIKGGVQKVMVERIGPNDFDGVFVGANYGFAAGKRTEASYTVTSPFGTEKSGTVPAQNFTAHWGELVAGIRVEFLPHIFVGWNLRGKFLLNAGSFKELSPNFIAGYGKGDKSTVFDFNFYLCYAIRWGKNGS